jgi:GTP-binding protein Era
MTEPISNPEPMHRCGLIALVGAPNVGKSTLINRLVGAKVAIVTPKAQTTRTRVLGIRMAGATQAVFIDTPGIFQPKRRLDRAMVQTAWREAGDADETCLLIDAGKGLDAATRAIAERLKQSGREVVAVFNKIDKVRRPRLLELAQELSAILPCRDVFMVAAINGDGVEDLFTRLAARLPEGPWLFPDDQLTDMPDRLMAAEITREKLMLSLRNELPYDLAVETEDWQVFQNGALRISQVIHIARDSQKGIVVGKGGERIKHIREASQRDLQDIYETPVHLFLHVKVRPGWDEDRAHFRDLGLDYNV